jgi:adenosylmethionine-8-amino-7-oxononanoate aminotransferase
MPASLTALDQAHVFHAYTSIAEHQRSGPHLLADAKGVWIRDGEGRELLDAMAGLWCVAAGYGREEIADAMADQARRLSYAHTFLAQSNEPGIRLAARVAKLTPPGLDHVFFCNSGSEANDTIVKLVWYHSNLKGTPAKKKIIARRHGYHGVTLAATSLSGLPNMHALFDAPLPGFLHVGKPHYYREAAPGESEADFAARLARELEERIVAEGPETVAAFIGEPLMAAGGVIEPPAGYWAAVQEVLDRYDVLLIADEVVCGFGRLGVPFGSDFYGLKPDFMTVAKAITSAYFPVSAAVVSDRVWEVFAAASAGHGPVSHGHTTSLHPVGAAAALANLDIFEREGLLHRAAEVGPRFQRALRDSVEGHPLVGEVRGQGLIAAVEIVADRATRQSFPPAERVGLRLHARCLEEGVICRAVAGDSLAFCPPLVIQDDELTEVVVRFGRGLDRLTAELGR